MRTHTHKQLVVAQAVRARCAGDVLQALALLNNAFVLRMSEGFAVRIAREAGDGITGQVNLAHALAYGRKPDAEEKKLGASLVAGHGMAALCRVLFNSNEFVVIE